MMAVNLFLLALLAGPAAPSQEPVKVLVAGVFHFDSPGLDMFNTKMKDILGERRQKEILDVARRLESFKPTKIAVEAPYSSTTAQDRLDQFLRGEYQLKESEIDQLALRIAKNLGHGRIYSVDFKQNMDMNSVFKYAKENGQGELVQQTMADFSSKMQPLVAESYVESNTMMKVLYDMNTPDFERMGHAMYMTMLRIGKDDQYVGADVVAGWNARNLKIATNVIRIADQPGDRVLLIIGAGHTPLIRQYLSQTPGFEVVDSLPFLKP